MNVFRYSVSSVLALAIVWVGLFGVVSSAAAQTEEILPVASTVVIAGDVPSSGSVVRYDVSTDQYTVTDAPGDTAIYGVVATRPAIVFVTASSAVPVVTAGVTPVRVSLAGGEIARGDILTTSAESGVAMKASSTEASVFAIALAAPDDTAGTVLAEVNQAKAQSLQANRIAAAAANDGSADPERPSLMRMVIATVMIIGALGFLLYSFRSILSSGIVSIGRNPRARFSVIYHTIGSMAMVLVVAGLVVLVALGVLVVPL